MADFGTARGKNELSSTSGFTAVTDFESTLGKELTALDGINSQNPENGMTVNTSFLGEYTNKLFGAPFQLMDSIDRRFPSVNPNVGSEYLRNFLLNSPILHIKPGMPYYTGNTDPTSLVTALQTSYIDANIGDGNQITSLLNSLVQNIAFGHYGKLQRRMFGFRESYTDYMSYVNYMCHSMAIFLGLTENNTGFPNGTFTTNNKFEPFTSIRWENYRMINSTYVQSPWEYANELLGIIGKDINSVAQTVLNVPNAIEGAYHYLFGDEDQKQEWVSNNSDLINAWNSSNDTSFEKIIASKVTSVQFMVEPTEFSESLDNMTAQSALESAIDGINEIGSEIAFMTNSNVDMGALGGLVDIIGDVGQLTADLIGGVVDGIGGGFMHNLFSGAIGSIKGEKMLYPEIYKSSKSTMNYNFSITLTSPYGDIYNYYMNIIVPLMHLIALASPRMVTSNTTTSPFLVQAYMPGMCTCHMGIIENMTITKNPSLKHVSVNGYPLSIKVTFTIKELYNAMAISPFNDPSSYLFNETLNDYMANLAGLIPSIDTYTKQRETMFENLNEYFAQNQWVADIVADQIQNLENTINPYVAR